MSIIKHVTLQKLLLMTFGTTLVICQLYGHILQLLSIEGHEREGGDRTSIEPMGVEFPTEISDTIVLLVVLDWRLSWSLSFREE